MNENNMKNFYDDFFGDMIGNMGKFFRVSPGRQNFKKRKQKSKN